MTRPLRSPPADTLAAKRFAEFFAGIGLMRMGLERAGWRVAFANDIDRDKQAMYAAHFSDAAAHFSLGDIHDLSPEALPDIALATASFPCNDLSLAGARGGLEGRHSSAYWGFIHILRGMGARRPPLVLLENVAGFLTSNGGRDLHSALTALNRLGYRVDVFLIDAAHFVPQSRVRLFVVGALREAPGEWIREPFPFYQGGESELRPKALADFIHRHPEIDWDVRPLPPLPRRGATLAEIVEALPDDSPYWWDAARRDYLFNQMSARHAALLRRMIDAPLRNYGAVFRRVRNGRSMAELRVDGLAGCLRTPRGGSGRQILVEAGGGRAARARLFTPRECARLMGADDFVIDAPLNKALFGFGDAVCVPVVAWIAEHCLEPLLQEMQTQTGHFAPEATQWKIAA